MTSTAIVADSGCDLPVTLLERYQIDQVSLIARFDSYELFDTPATRAEFWYRFDASQPPQSSAPSAGAWAEAFRNGLRRCDEVVAITVTSKHSSTYNSAVIASAEFGGSVRVFDSWSVSLGEGLIVLRAAELAESGAGSHAILAALQAMRPQLRVWFLLDTLDAVQRGGRLTPVISALKRISSLLSIKPILALNEGVIELDGMARSLRRGVQVLVDRCRQQPVLVAAVGHTRQQELAEETASVLAAVTGIARDHILVAEAGPALGVHAGPGAIGLGVLLA